MSSKSITSRIHSSRVAQSVATRKTLKKSAIRPLALHMLTTRTVIQTGHQFRSERQLLHVLVHIICTSTTNTPGPEPANHQP